MAGSLKPSTVKEEANYTLLDGNISGNGYGNNGSVLFNQTKAMGGNTEGNYKGAINTNNYIILDIKDYTNIYANISMNYILNDNPGYNYAKTGKLQILKYDGTDYTIDVTDKYWIGRSFSFSSATKSNHGLTFEEFLSVELIDREWQKIVEWLPPGQYKFINISKTDRRNDNEWFLEKVVPYSKTIKSGVVNTIKNHEMIQKHIPFRIQS